MPGRLCCLPMRTGRSNGEKYKALKLIVLLVNLQEQHIIKDWIYKQSASLSIQKLNIEFQNYM